MKKKHVLSIAGAIALLVGGVSYWYIFAAGAPQLDPLPVDSHTGLSFRLESFYSPAMGQQRTYGLILPPGYKTHSQQHYPVIFLLHGGHGGPEDLQKKESATSVLHALYQRHLLPAAIIITPDGNDLRGSSPFFDPDYFDGPNGAVSTAIGAELVQVVKSRYRTLNQPQFWAMGGLSSGGWGALNIGLRHLNHFRILFSHSGYFVDRSGFDNSPNLFIRRLPPETLNGLKVYLDAGQDDPDFVAATQQFHQTLNQLGIVNEFHIFPGGHGLYGQDVGWNYWRKHLTNSLTFVGKQFALSMSMKSAKQPVEKIHDSSQAAQLKGRQ